MSHWHYWHQRLGVDAFGFWCDSGLPHAEKKKSRKLFIKRVVPAFVSTLAVGGNHAPALAVY
jgi:hypothetical protein